MESCERCPLSYSIEWHWSHVSIFLLTKVFSKRKLIVNMQFISIPVGLKLKVVKDVLCPLLLMDTCLTSIFLLSKVITKINVILDMQFPFLPEGVKWKVRKHVHCPLLLMDTGLMSLSSC